MDEDVSPSLSPIPQENFNSFTANSPTTNKPNHITSVSQSNPVDDLLGLFGNANVTETNSNDGSNSFSNDLLETTNPQATQNNNNNNNKQGLEDLLS